MKIKSNNAIVFTVALLIPICVLIYCIASTSSNIVSNGIRATDSLRFLVIVSRHGNRRPLKTFPNDPYPSWPYGLKELTIYGRKQLYNLGVKVRLMYDGFLKSEYKREDLYAVSTPVDRTLMSGEAFLAGLYPPRDYQIWKNDLHWQPIPLFYNENDCGWVFHNSCPSFEHDLNKSLTKFLNENNQQISAIQAYLNRYSGMKVTGIREIYTVFDTLFSEDTESLELPSWTSEVYPEPMKELMGKYAKSYSLGSFVMTKIILNHFLEEVLTAIKSKTNGTLSQKLHYYSDHDYTITNLQAALGMSSSEVAGFVNPGSALILELHQDPLLSQKYFIQVLFIDGLAPNLEPTLLKQPGCGNPCELKTLMNISQEFLNFTTYDKECN